MFVTEPDGAAMTIQEAVISEADPMGTVKVAAVVRNGSLPEKMVSVLSQTVW